ncbi:hypothetical protein BH18VER2_BH18VER2_14490 [soil metagenome]
MRCLLLIECTKSFSGKRAEILVREIIRHRSALKYGAAQLGPLGCGETLHLYQDLSDRLRHKRILSTTHELGKREPALTRARLSAASEWNGLQAVT